MKHIILAAIVAALAVPTTAAAAGGSVAINGGTAAEQQVVQHALDTDRFPWSLAGPVTVTITTDPALTHDVAAWSEPGTIWIQSSWLDVGNLHIIQHEMTHQVDYFSLSDPQRAQLLAYLGGSTWSNDGTTPHNALGSERFAEELAAIYGHGPADGRDAIVWRPALAMDTELVRVGLLPHVLLNHRVCKLVRVVKVVRHKRHVIYVRRCRTV